MDGRYVIGLDFGTLSVRGILMDLSTGNETASREFAYPHGVMDRALPGGRPLPHGFALQDPRDYLDVLTAVVRGLMEETGTPPESVAGIGFDFTSSTTLPVTEDGTPLCALERFREEPQAYVKLWKHHGSEEEAALIGRISAERNEKWLPRFGGKVSAEFLYPRILEMLRRAPEVYDACAYYIEAMDWITWQLTGTPSGTGAPGRSACAAGYKAFYSDEDGFPDRSYFREIDPRLENIRDGILAGPVQKVGGAAGYLTAEMAGRLGLLPGTPVGVPVIDAHAGMPGAGITEPGTVMVIVGTSSVQLTLLDHFAVVPGIQAVAKDSIIPGYYGYEAGQCSVGDLYSWFVKNGVPGSYEEEARAKKIGIHGLLCEKLRGVKPGESGLLAIDWFNGVRTPFQDYSLSGAVLGLTLRTKPEEIYLSLIEATAYGTRRIIELIEEGGCPVDRIVLAGGIPRKNPLLTRVYTDICGKEVLLSENGNMCCRGAAILGAAAADPVVTGFRGLPEAASALGDRRGEILVPDPENAAVYDRLYREYVTLSDYFAAGGNDVMKRLMKGI